MVCRFKANVCHCIKMTDAILVMIDLSIYFYNKRYMTLWHPTLWLFNTANPRSYHRESLGTQRKPGDKSKKHHLPS